MTRVIYIRHPPVIQDLATPVPDWGLSPDGFAQMQAIAALPDMAGITPVFSSTEQKSRDGAGVLARALNLHPQTRADLGENDRSATGYLPPDQFELAVDSFFAHPDTSFRGWETARAAQTRIVAATRACIFAAPTGDIAIIAHGGVGALLMAHARGVPISRATSAPAMGAWFILDRNLKLGRDWQDPPNPPES